jgi:hypothetical protein
MRYFLTHGCIQLCVMCSFIIASTCVFQPMRWVQMGVCVFIPTDPHVLFPSLRYLFPLRCCEIHAYIRLPVASLSVVVYPGVFHPYSSMSCVSNSRRRNLAHYVVVFPRPLVFFPTATLVSKMRVRHFCPIEAR